jgi:hypothetical protein
MGWKPSRRTILASISVQFAAISGCTGALLDSSGSSDDCNDGSTRIRASEVPSDERQEDADPIRVNELSDEERKVLVEAIEDGEYVECGSGSEELNSVIERIQEHFERRGETEFAYAVYRDNWYDLSAYRFDEDVTAG